MSIIGKELAFGGSLELELQRCYEDDDSDEATKSNDTPSPAFRGTYSAMKISSLRPFDYAQNYM